MRKRHMLWLLALTILMFGTTACTSLATLHNARPTPKGEVEFAVATGVYGAYILDAPSGADAHGVVPTIAEFSVRYGISDSLDFGVHAYVPGLKLDFNWMLVDVDGGFALSINPAFSGMYFSVGDDSLFYGAAWLGILLDVVHTDFFTLTLGPRGGYQFVTASVTEDSATASATADGGLVGGVISFRMQFTEGFGLMPEFSIYNILVEGPDALVYNGSLVFIF